MEKVRKICVILVDRANYGRLWPVMKAIEKHPVLELQTVCAGTMLLERFGQAEKIVAKDGFKIDGRVYFELEGSVPTSMAKSVGLGIIEFVSEYQRLSPDIVLIIGDRYEALAAAIAAAYMNLKIAHIQGGEVSGSIDESARHAISKFAHIHFPSTRRSAEYLIKMGENPEFVFNVGCPAGDYIINLDSSLPENIFDNFGVGAHLDVNKPFLLVIYHPVTTNYGTERAKAEALINALGEISYPTLWLWPNIDAGADDISKALRSYRENNDCSWLHLVKNLDPLIFQKSLKACACAVGNSSSFIRDSTFSGTPVVLVGDRQVGREIDINIINVLPEKEQIKGAILEQLKVGRYPTSGLYGKGDSSARIAKLLSSLNPEKQKRLHYIFDNL